MNQKVRESLSAIMDGEGDELELRRVLKSLSESSEESDTWRRYHVIGSIMRREHAIDVSTDISVAVRQRLEAQQPPSNDIPLYDTRVSEVGGSVAKRHFGRFSFMGNAAVAAAVSLMVITGVQVYRGSGGGNMFEGQSPSGMASIADSSSANNSGQVGGGDLNTVGLVSEPANQYYDNSGSSGNSSLFPSYASSNQMSNTDAKRQARLLKGFLDQHAQDADFQPQAQLSTINAGFMGASSQSQASLP